ncbi:hypothetical protein GCM10023189_09890 [Nibrella saemangeumensis]|uniref:Uncharacterized protein n=1 Tax=Nibrella saemangeumensis TaxID=1084526 RepID=A0ABP8MGL6_9BACT
MRSPFFYIFLLVLVVLDGWLLAHPNIIGKVGVFVYDYAYLRTFPRAVGTVTAVVGVALLLSWVVRRLSRPAALTLSALLLVLGVLWLIQSIGQFTSGVYRLTGAGFKAGAILLPGLATLVFAAGLVDVLLTKTPKVRQRSR